MYLDLATFPIRRGFAPLRSPGSDFLVFCTFGWSFHDIWSRIWGRTSCSLRHSQHHVNGWAPTWPDYSSQGSQMDQIWSINNIIKLTFPDNMGLVAASKPVYHFPFPFYHFSLQFSRLSTNISIGFHIPHYYFFWAGSNENDFVGI